MLRAVSRSFVRLAPARAPLRLGARCLVAQGSPPRLASDDEPDFDDDLLEEHPAIMRRIDAVRVLHERHSALCDELAEKVEALTLEYDAKLAPILARRADIVSGRSEPTDDEAKPLDAYMSKLSTPPGEAEPGIPGFWLTAITEHEALSDAVTEEDAPVLEYLQDVQCLKFRPGERTRATLAGGGGAPEEGKKRRSAPPEGVDELAGFELVFSFAPNPYFEEPVLRKVVWMDEGYPAATHASTIKWKQGKDVTHRTVVKHSKRQNRKVKALEPVPSFFHFFESRVFEFDEADFAPGADRLGGGGQESGASESEIERHMEDLRMTLTFRDELVPNAAEWAAVIVDEDEEGQDAR